MTLGEQIRSARESRNMSQEELAEQMGVSRQAVSKWENDASVPQGANLGLLATLLDLEFSKQETKPSRRTGILWIVSAIAAFVLLIVIIVIVGIEYHYRTYVLLPSTEAVGDEEYISSVPVLLDVQFYDDDFERVGDSASWYDSADIHCILVQWEKGTPEHIKILYMPIGTDTSEQTELLLTKNIPAGSSAVLLGADVIKERPEGHIYFELDFDGSPVASETYNLFCGSGLAERGETLASGTPEILVYIEEIKDGMLLYDAAEWVTIPGQRAAELGIEENDAGFVVYNEDMALEECALADDCVCVVLDWMDSYEPVEVTIEELQNILLEREGLDIPYILSIEGDRIVRIEEHYLP